MACLYVSAFFNFRCKIDHISLFFYFLLSAKYIEKLTTYRPSDIQLAPKLRAKFEQVALTMLPNSTCAPPSLDPFALGTLIFFRLLFFDVFWLFLGCLLVPSAAPIFPSGGFKARRIPFPTSAK